MGLCYLGVLANQCPACNSKKRVQSAATLKYMGSDNLDTSSDTEEKGSITYFDWQPMWIIYVDQDSSKHQEPDCHLRVSPMAFRGHGSFFLKKTKYWCTLVIGSAAHRLQSFIPAGVGYLCCSYSLREGGLLSHGEHSPLCMGCCCDAEASTATMELPQRDVLHIFFHIPSHLLIPPPMVGG